ncbi:MAG: DUF2207 domain-containing protein [Clostridia bacterium]|nr:DUF2207 domain-containing protein [Clostridia bacterium]
MKKAKKIILYCVLALFGVLVCFAFMGIDAIETGELVNLSYYDESQDNVSIHNLYVDAVVRDDNSVKVTETFDVTFNDYGLTEVVRFIPYATKVQRIDKNGKIQESMLYARITGISGTGDKVESCNIYQDEIAGCTTIGLKARSSVPVGTTRSYQISYTYHMGEDKNKGYDDVYYNIVGVNSLLTIKNVSFKITLPMDYTDMEDVKIYTGEYGSDETIAFGWDGNVLTGSCDKLGPLEGITLRAIFEDGYLKYEETVSVPAIVALVTGIVMFAIAIAVFILYKQNKKVLEPVELIIPEGLTPLKAEFFAKKDCSVKGIIASLVILANKGYLKINEREDGEIELIKLQDIKDSEDYSLKAIFRGLFNMGRELVLVSELEKDSAFADAQVAVCTSENAKGNRALYDKKAESKMAVYRVISLVLIVLIVIMMIVTTTVYFGMFSNVVSPRAIILAMLCLALIICMFVCKSYVPTLIISIFTASLMLAFYFVGGYNVFDNHYLVLVAFILMGISVTLMCGESKYSKSGALKKGRALGFKRFIEKCEVDQIKAFAYQNPSYYFDVLPYAYVYGLTDVWIKKFETLSINPPEWMSTNGDYLTDIIIFNHMFDRFSKKTYVANQKMMYSRIQSSISSGSSGGSGGFSGGGGGGGFSGGGGGGGGFGAR